MPEIFVKEFSDIATSAGIPKMTKLRKEKTKPAYAPAQDFYKQLREAIEACHEKNLGTSHVVSIANSCQNPDRKPKYQALAKAYAKWIGKNNHVWFKPPRQRFVQGNVEIIINPELGLVIGGKKSLIKLYFNQEPITQARANYILHLMDATNNSAYNCLVLDVKKGKTISFTGNTSYFNASCVAELAYIDSVWPNL